MRERMLSGGLYVFSDPELQAEHARGQALLERYNATRHTEADERRRLLHELLGQVGDGVVIQPPLRCDYGPRVAVGEGTFVNYDCIFLDAAPITIGRHCQLAPQVQIVTATHPIDPEPRRLGWEYAEPVAIGDNVWLGAGVIVCPGVTIGDDTVVGAGAVVTRDLPSGVVAVGHAARALRGRSATGTGSRPRIAAKQSGTTRFHSSPPGYAREQTTYQPTQEEPHMPQAKADRSASAKKAAATRERNRQRAQSETSGKKAAATRQGNAASQAAGQAKRAAGAMVGAGKTAARAAGSAAKQAGKAAGTRGRASRDAAKK